MRTNLIIAAHPDDEVLGLGGTIKKLANCGDTNVCLILGEGITSRRGKREDTEQSHLCELKKDTLKAASIIGYSKVFFSDLPDNRFDSVDLIDIVKIVEKYVSDIRPNRIYTHHYGDLNIDHRITFESVITACRPIVNIVSEIYCFETPSSTEWNFKYGDSSFRPNVFIDIEDTIEFKLKAMGCYKTEIREYPHPRSLKGLETSAMKWGMVAGCAFAEPFELIRKVE